jgi:hypothetical protein
VQIPRRRTHAAVPTEVTRALPLQVGESPLAGARDRSGRWYVGTAVALLLPDGDGWERLPWEQVERATWDRESEQLVVVETADFGRPEPTHRATLPDPERLLELIRERVTASIVVKLFEPVDGRRGVTVAGRRSPHSDAPVAWSVLVDPGLDADAAPVRAAAERALGAAQSEIGL